MTAVTLNGHSYSDDGSQSRDMRFGGHQSWLLPMLQDAMTEVDAANNAAISADASAIAAAASATSAANYAAALKGTSTTSLSITVASKSLTTQTGKQFVAGQYVLLVDHVTPAKWMLGSVTSYNAGTGALVVNVEDAAGTGTIALWDILLSGKRGAQGPAGVPTGLSRLTRTSNTQLVAGDSGTLIQITSGTFDQTFVGSSTLGNGWWCYYVNNGSGTITLNPSGAETIDGLATRALLPGESRLIQCDGTNLLSVELTQVSASVPMDAFVLIPPSADATATSPNTFSYLGGTYLKTGVLSDKATYPNAQLVSNTLYSSVSAAAENIGGAATDGAGNVFGRGSTTNKLVFYDGSTWSIGASSPSFTSALNAKVSTRWISVDGAAAGSRKALYSTDGLTFTENATAMPSSKYWTSVASSGSRCVAVSQASGGGASTQGAYTDDGITWTSTTLPSASWVQVFRACGKFIAINNATSVNNYAYSSDGITWNSGTFPASVRVDSTFYSGAYCCVSGNPTTFFLTGGGNTYTTTDLINWTLLSGKNWTMKLLAKVGSLHLIFAATVGGGSVLATTDFSTITDSFNLESADNANTVLAMASSVVTVQAANARQYAVSQSGYVGSKTAATVSTGNGGYGGSAGASTYYYKRVA